MGIPVQKFSHYAIQSGENKGETPFNTRSSELDRSLNVECRGFGIVARYGSSAETVNGSGYPSPIVPAAGTQLVKTIQGFAYGSSSFDCLFTVGQILYRTPSSPVSLYSLSSNVGDAQYAIAGDVIYYTNGTDPVLYYNPNLSTTQAYAAGFGTPGTFTAEAVAAGGSMAAGTYSYYVIWYDSRTETKSNPQTNPVTVVVAGPNSSVILGDDGDPGDVDLPIDGTGEATHWIIYRKGPNEFYHYFLAKVTYNAGAPTYIDTAAATGRSQVVEFDNDSPDVSDGIFYHEDFKTMMYFSGNVITWGKKYRHQNVPTYNRELLDDNSQDIIVGVAFKEAAVFFKTDSIYVMLGDPGGDYTMKKISASIGTRSPHSVVVDSDGIYFFDSKGKPRFLSPTDFSSEDLRDTTDISHKYRVKFARILPQNFSKCFAVLWKTAEVSQYRLFVPIETNDGTCEECYVYDISIALHNGGDSAWFNFRYNYKLVCGAVVADATAGSKLLVGDDYGLIWRLDHTDIFYDAANYTRLEGGGAVTFGANSVTIAGATFAVNEHVGKEVVILDEYTYREEFRSKITSNTATTLTYQATSPTLTTSNPFITIGGYLTYFATTWFSRDNACKNVPEKMSIAFDRRYDTTELQAFVHYDLNTIFNLTYDYMNNPVNPSGTYLGDNYSLILTDNQSLYDDAIYDANTYDQVTYELVDFLLRSYYYFSSVSWGIVTREPDKPFGYIGGSLFYKSKKDLL